MLMKNKILELLKTLLSILGAATLIFSVIKPILPDNSEMLEFQLLSTLMAFTLIIVLNRNFKSLTINSTVTITALSGIIYLWIFVPSFPPRILEWTPSPEEFAAMQYTQNLSEEEAYKAGTIHYARNEYNSARQAFTAASKNKNIAPYALNRLANLERVEENLQRAVEVYDLVIQQANSMRSAKDRKSILVNSLVNRGVTLRRIAQAEEANSTEWNLLQERALKNFIEASSIDPSFSRAWYNAGQVYFDLNELNSAREQYLKAYYANTQYGRAAYNLAAIAAIQGKTAEALPWVERTLQIDAAAARSMLNDSDFSTLSNHEKFINLTDKAATGVLRPDQR